MGDTKIEWTDTTANPVRGCTKVSPGCAHCYAETFAERFRGVKGHPYEQGFDLRLVPEKLAEPLSWKKPRRVFVNSMSDLFQDGVEVEFIARVFAVMAMAPEHTFQVLTKRAQRMRDVLNDPSFRDEVEVWITMMLEEEPALARRVDVFNRRTDDPRAIAPDVGGEDWPLPNVWLGVSVENQRFADERIPLLLQTPAAVRFISAEPLLEAVDLLGVRCFLQQHSECRRLDWVIVGGESGHGARPFDIAWARSIITQCKAGGVACFVKQLGSEPMEGEKHFMEMTIGARSIRLNSRKGGDMDEWPDDLRVREFPQMATA